MLTLSAGQPTLDGSGLSVTLPSGDQLNFYDEYDGIGVESTNNDMGSTYTLTVALYNASGPALPCSPPPFVQLSLCLVAGNRSPPNMSQDEFTAFASGVLTTSSTNYSASQSYVVTSASGQFYVLGSPSAAPVSLLRPLQYGANDNLVTVVAGSAQAVVDNQGLSLYSSDTSIHVYESLGVGMSSCDNLNCGPYSHLLVQQLLPGGAPISCQPPVVQFSFRLVTGDADPPSLSSASGFLTVTSGIMNTSAVAYNADGAYPILAVTGLLTAQLDGGLLPAAPVQVAPEPFGEYFSFKLQDGLVDTSHSGLTLASSLMRLRVSQQTPSAAGQAAWPDQLSAVRPVLAADRAAVHARRPDRAVQPSALRSAELLSRHCSAEPCLAVHRRVLNLEVWRVHHTAVGFNSNGSYNRQLGSGGQFHTVANGLVSASPVTLAAVGSYGDNDNVLLLSGGQPAGLSGRAGHLAGQQRLNSDAAERLLAGCVLQRLRLRAVLGAVRAAVRPGQPAAHQLLATGGASFCLLLTGTAAANLSVPGSFTSYTAGLLSTSSLA